MPKRSTSQAIGGVVRAGRDVDPRKAAAAAGITAATVTAAVAGRRRRAQHADEQTARAFRLHPGEPVADGVRRIVRGQLDLAIEQLHEAEKGDPGEPVHEARKALKRTRAVARLARDALGDEVYRRENTEFRDTGRRLSDARDSEVMIETLDALQRRYGDEIPAGSMDRLRDQLAAEHREAIERLRQDAGTVEQSVQVLQAARVRIAGWTLERDGLEALAPGAQRIYRRGRRSKGGAISGSHWLPPSTAPPRTASSS